MYTAAGFLLPESNVFGWFRWQTVVAKIGDTWLSTKWGWTTEKVIVALNNNLHKAAINEL